MFNIINPRAIEDFLRELSEADRRLFALMRQSLLRPLMREEAAVIPIARYPARPPAWLTEEKFRTGGPFYRFCRARLVASAELYAAVWTVKSWLKRALEMEEPWIGDRDAAGRVRRLVNIGRLEDVVALAEKDTARSLSRGTLKAVPGADDPDRELVLQLERGLHWIRLKTPAALAEEAAMMRHCLGNGQYDVMVRSGVRRYYSLRDARGRAHVTLEVREGVVSQRSGRGNSDANARWRDAIAALEQFKGWDSVAPFPRGGALYVMRRVRPDLYCTQDSKVIDGHLDLSGVGDTLRLPSSLRITGTLDLTGATGLLGLPTDLSVGGDLLLDGAVNLVRMPEWLWVAGDLTMRNCRKVRVLGPETAVRGNLTLRGCRNLLRLPMQLRVGRTLDITGCGEMTWIPDKAAIKGAIVKGRYTFRSAADANHHFSQRR